MFKIPRPDDSQIRDVYIQSRPYIEQANGRKIPFAEFKVKVLAELDVMEQEVRSGRMPICTTCDVIPEAWANCPRKGPVCGLAMDARS